MKQSDFIQRIEERFPKAAALSFDNVGLLVGRIQKEVQRVYVALDATDAVIDEAVAWQADVLLTHHPLWFSPRTSLTDAETVGHRLMKLAEAHMSCYALHTNYDVLRMGDAVAERLQGGGHSFIAREVLDISFEERYGIGFVGTLEAPVSLEACCRWVKERFSLPSVKVFGDGDRLIQKVAVSPGSGKSMIGAAVSKGADVLVTGDIGHHEGLDANGDRLAVIDASHYGLEQVFTEDMVGFLAEHMKEVTVKAAPYAFPFQVL